MFTHTKKFQYNATPDAPDPIFAKQMQEIVAVIFFLSFLAVVVLVAVHLFSDRLRFLEGTPRSVWLSVAGGVSVGYVFVHLLPELTEGQAAIAEAAGEGLAFLEQHVYLVALFGLATFYVLDRLATESRRRKLDAGGEDATSSGMFWIHTSSFAVCNVLTGYLLLKRLASGLDALVLFALVMALHFVVNDCGLREAHKRLYTRTGRWVISAAVVLDWLLGSRRRGPRGRHRRPDRLSRRGRNPERTQRGAPGGAPKPLLGLRRRRRHLRRPSPRRVLSGSGAWVIRTTGRLLSLRSKSLLPNCAKPWARASTSPSTASQGSCTSFWHVRGHRPLSPSDKPPRR